MTRHASTINPQREYQISRWFRSLLGRRCEQKNREPIYVKVWDGQRQTYRLVDLNNRNDPLWSNAYALVGCSKGGRGRSKRRAAA